MLQPMPSLNSSLHLMNPTPRNSALMHPPGYSSTINSKPSQVLPIGEDLGGVFESTTNSPKFQNHEKVLQ
jgi:hypothetical protein